MMRYNNSYKKTDEMLALLLKYRYISWRNALYRGDIKKRRRRLLARLSLLLIPTVIFFNIFFTFQALLAVLPQGQRWLYLIFSSSMLVLFLMMLFSALAIVIHSLFLAKDLPLLFSSPLSVDTIFRYKLIDAVIANSTLFWAAGLPLFLAFGLCLQLSPVFYLYAIVNAILFLFIPVGLAAALAIGLVSIVPAKKAKSIATVIFSILSLLLWGGLQYLRPERIEANSTFYSTDTIHMLELEARAYTAYFPSQWLSDALFAFAASQFVTMAINTLLLLLTCAVLYTIAAITLKKAFRRDLFSGNIGTVSMRAHPLSERPAASNPKSVDNLILLTLWWKDLKILFRDSRYSMQIFLYGVIMIVSPLIGPGHENQWPGTMQPYSLYLYLFLFAALLSGGWAARLLPVESRCLSHLLSSPQRRRTFLVAKILVALSLSLLCGITAMVVMQLLHPASLITVGQVFMALLAVSLGSSGVGIGVGTWFANYEWDHPKRMLTSGGNLLYMMATFSLLGLYAAVIWATTSLFSIGLSLVVLLLLASLLAGLGTVVSEKKLEKMEWQY